MKKTDLTFEEKIRRQIEWFGSDQFMWLLFAASVVIFTLFIVLHPSN